MKLILSKDTDKGRADYRDDICCICGEECNPHFRYFYYTKEGDKYGNSIIDGEVSSCLKCNSKMKEFFK